MPGAGGRVSRQCGKKGSSTARNKRPAVSAVLTPSDLCCSEQAAMARAALTYWMPELALAGLRPEPQRAGGSSTSTGHSSAAGPQSGRRVMFRENDALDCEVAAQMSSCESPPGRSSGRSSIYASAGACRWSRAIWAPAPRRRRRRAIASRRPPISASQHSRGATSNGGVTSNGGDGKVDRHRPWWRRRFR